MYSHPRDPIVSGLILQSGTVQMAQQMLNRPLSDVDSEFVRVAKKVGCANDDRKAELECMRKVDAQKLKNAISSSKLNKIGSPYGGMPMVDNKILFTREEYERRGNAGEFALVVRKHLIPGNLELKLNHAVAANSFGHDKGRGRLSRQLECQRHQQDTL